MSDADESPEQTAARIASEQPATEAAAAGQPPPDMPEVYIGAPFAVGSAVTIVEAEAVVEAEDGTQFVIDLLSGAYKRAPGEGGAQGPRLTHMLVIAPDDDDQIVSDVSGHILYANDLAASSPLLEDEEEDEQE